MAGVVHTSLVGVGVPDQSAPVVLALSGTVWHCVALCCTVLHCVALCGTMWHCVALCCTVWHCVAHLLLCHQQHTGTTSTPAASAASSEGRWSSARGSARSSARSSATSSATSSTRGRRASQHMTMQPEYTHTVLYALAHNFLC